MQMPPLLGLAGQRCVQQIECHQGLLSSEQSRCLSAVEIEGYIMNISCVTMQIDTLFNSLGKDIYINSLGKDITYSIVSSTAHTDVEPTWAIHYATPIYRTLPSSHGPQPKSVIY
jgi:hypothetical protein